jgi:DNA repair photolyase
MPLKKSQGNMYPWVTHTHTHLGGECPHKCVYCYVDNPRWGRPKRYTGVLRLLEQEFKVDYDSGKVIFIEHCNDLWAAEVDPYFICRVLMHLEQYPENTFVFQTKNPFRYLKPGPHLSLNTIKDAIFGCTIETNRNQSRHF